MKHFNLLSNFRWFTTVILLITFGIGQMGGTTAFSETFAKCTGTLGWSGNVAQGTFTTDNSGWTTANAYGAGGSAKFGTGSKKGTAQTPNISCGTATTATLTFKAGAWNASSEKTTLVLTYTNCSGDKSSVTMKKGEFTNYTVALSDITGNIKIQFAGQNSNDSRFLLDDVVVTYTAASCSANPTIGTASLNGSISLSSLPVQTTGWTVGANCAWTDFGFVWSSTVSTPTLESNGTASSGCTKIQKATSGTSTSTTHSITGSFSTGNSYYVRGYGKNGYASGSYQYTSVLTITPRSVTFDLNGHGSSAPSTQYVNNGDKATDPSYSESVTGYTFGGWYKEAGCSNSWTFGTDVVSGANKTLYAKWTAKTYTIDLDQDLTPTSAGTTSISVTYNANTNLTSAITKPTKTGWTFAGYYTEKNGSGTQIIGADGNVIASVSGYTDASKNWIGTSDVTLYAKWTCTVTWSVNGATNVYDAQTLTYNGTSTKVASVPSGSDLDLENDYCGDVFVGWTTTNIGSTGLDKDDDSSEISDLGLFTTVAGSPELKTVGNTTFYAVFADYTTE